MVGRTMGIAAAALLLATGAAWAQTGPSTSGAAGAAQSQGVTAAPQTSATPAPGAPAAGNGSGATAGTGLGATGALGGSPAAQTTVPTPPPSSAKP